MELTFTSVIKKDEEKLIGSDLGDEMVLMNIINGDYYGFNEVATDIWILLSKPISINQICVEIIQQYDVTEENCKSSVMNIISEMHKEELIEIIST